VRDVIGQTDNLRQLEIGIGLGADKFDMMPSDGGADPLRQPPLFQQKLAHPGVIGAPDIFFDVMERFA